MSTPMPKQGDFCWHDLMTPDVEKAKKFYGALFNWQTEALPMEEGMTYTMLKNGDNGIGGMVQIQGEQYKDMPPHWLSYIQVDNLDDMLKKAQELGGSITMPKNAAGDFGHFAIIRDPTGAHIALWQSAKKGGC